MNAQDLGRGHVRPADAHRWIEPFPGECVAIHAERRDTGGRFGCGEALLRPGAGQPRHIHHGMEELLYVLAGRIDFELDGRRFRCEAGGFMFIPRGTPHSFRNLSDAPARLLGIFSPDAMEGFFDAVNRAPAEAFPEIARRHGIEIVGPMLEPLP